MEFDILENETYKGPVPLDFQVPAINYVVDRYLNEDGGLVLASTGAGKTYIISQAIRILQSRGHCLISEDGLDALLRTCSVLIVTPKQVKSQFYREGVIKHGLKDVRILSYNELASSAGHEFITWNERVNSVGDTWQEPEWNEDNIPDLIVLDECHNVKNSDALKSKCIDALVTLKNEKPSLCKTQFFHLSATPYVKLSDTQILLRSMFPEMSPRSWKDRMLSIAGLRCNWQAPSPAASKRLNEWMTAKRAVHEVTGVKYLKRAFTKNILIEPSIEVLEAINEHYEAYLRKRAELKRHASSSQIIEMWVAWLKFREACEILMAPYLAEQAAYAFKERGKQIIIAANFTEPLALIWKELVKTHGISQDKISIIQGGQTDRERDREKDKFQTGRSDFLLLAAKCGGTGLSLDNNGDHSAQRAREVFIPPTWSPIEMVQILGRAHRVKTISTTRQYICWFKGTIQERVAAKAALGIKCLQSLVTRKVSWIDIANEEATSDELSEKIYRETMEDDEDSEGAENNEIFHALGMEE